MSNDPVSVFCKFITEKAKSEGWLLQLAPGQGFVWRKKSEQPIVNHFPGLNAIDMLHQACIWIESNQEWTTEIEIPNQQ
jgi:hypothetical protein